MGIFREIPPTAGLLLYLKDFLSLIPIGRRENSLEDDFKNYLGVPYAKVTYSGTAAFYLILESVKRISSKRTVIIPSFICPLVPLAISRAGLKIKVCDINKDNFNFDLNQLRELCLKNNDIMAVVAVHLGGIPLDLEAIKPIAEEHKIFIIEDCAQSLGASYKGKKTGTSGEFSFFSLCRGKGLTIYEGGLIVTAQKEYCAMIEDTVKRFVNNDILSESLKIIELLGYWIFYRPRLFWFVYRLPQIFWNWRGENLKAANEYFSIDFPIHKVSGLRKSIGHSAFGRLEEEIAKQRQKAADYMEKLNLPGLKSGDSSRAEKAQCHSSHEALARGFPCLPAGRCEGLKDIRTIKIIKEPGAAKATYPYLTLIFDEPARCQKAKRIFNNYGLGVSFVYLSAVTDYGYLKGILEEENSANGRYLAERIITLTTSTFLKNEELDSLVEMIKNL